ncbi:MAG: FecR domain-containing protein [Phyllobacterium sp.]|uniref:FecR family protein n=1 Tax=Phyllobacterium sp. TaxID=1871046 RepID=UPI0030F14813
MTWMRGAAIVALSLALFSPRPAVAAEAIGEAVRIKTEVTGAGGSLAVADPVHRNERISTSPNGLGQFVFKDGTKLAVGWGSSVTLDKFVFDDSDKVKKLTIKAAKGTFRWISGNSKSSAYEIVTPAGTIGVRGTAFDVYIDRDGTTAVVLLNGAVGFCGPGGCRQLTKRCDCVVARPNGRMTNPARVNQGIFKTLGNTRALPFLSGSQQLSTGFGRFATGCGLSTSLTDPAQTAPERSRPRTAPQAPAPPAPSPAPVAQNQPDPPSPPAPPSAPAPPAPPARPDPPGSPGSPDPQQTPPDPPDKPHKPDKEHHHHGKHDHHDHDRDDDHHDRDRRGGDSRSGGRHQR